MRSVRLAGLVVGVFVAGCGDDVTNGEIPSFAGSVQPIFSASCATGGCHTGATPQENLDLSQGRAYGAIVNVPSVQVPTMRRVRPGEPDQSYLVHKIQDTQSQVGGEGSRMPKDLAPLSADQISLIRAWITGGAPNN